MSPNLGFKGQKITFFVVQRCLFLQWLFNWVKKRVSNFSLLGFYNDLSFTVAWEKSLKSDKYNFNI